MGRAFWSDLRNALQPVPRAEHTLLQAIQWLTAETVSVGVSASNVNVSIGCCCRLSLLLALGPFDKDSHDRGPATHWLTSTPDLCVWWNLLTRAHLDTHTCALLIRTCISAHAHKPHSCTVTHWCCTHANTCTSSYTRGGVDSACGTCAHGGPGWGVSWAPVLLICLLSSQGRELRSYTVTSLHCWLKCLWDWSWGVIIRLCAVSLLSQVDE